MGAIGETLRRERLKSGLDLDRISQETKIPARLLQAIEEEEFDKLPGRLFTISFVRQYAQTLGLDEEQVIADLRAQQEPPLPVTTEPAEPPPDRTAARGTLAGAVLLLLVSLAFVFWPSNNAPRAATAQRTAITPSQDSADRVTEPARSEAQGTPRETPALTAPAGLRLVLTARARTWVTVKLNRQNLFAGTLQPNESKVLEGAGRMDLVIGTPAALELLLNGKPVDLTGPRGQLADVRITWPDGVSTVSYREPLEDIY